MPGQRQFTTPPPLTTTGSFNPPIFSMMDLLGSASGSSSTPIYSRALLMLPYMKAWNNTALPYHFLMVIFIEALVHMGWCDYNPGLGFKIESHSGESLCLHLLPMASFYPDTTSIVHIQC